VLEVPVATIHIAVSLKAIRCRTRGTVQSQLRFRTQGSTCLSASFQ